MAVLRSNKYKAFDDEQILRLYRQKPLGEAHHFLMVEIEERRLQAAVDEINREQKKGSRHSIWYYLFYLVLAMLFFIRFGDSL